MFVLWSASPGVRCIHGRAAVQIIATMVSLAPNLMGGPPSGTYTYRTLSSAAAAAMSPTVPLSVPV